MTLCFDNMRNTLAAELIVGGRLRHHGWWASIGHELAGEIVAVVFYTQPDTEEDVQMHVVAKPGSAWCTSAFVTAAFRYPFAQLALARVSATANIHNTAFQRFLKALGFVQEGIKRRMAGGRDYVMFGMLREECRYVRG